MIILSIHSGPHDSAAALFDSYTLKAAVHQERLTRKKGAGGFPEEAISEVLDINGLTPKDIDQVVLSRGSWPVQFMHFSKQDEIRFRFKKYRGHRQYHKSIYGQQIRQGLEQPEPLWRDDVFRKAIDISKDTPIYFANHHYSHALSAFFYTDFDNALLYTADGGGDGVFSSARIYQNGELTCLYGDDRHALTQNMTNSLGLVYGYCTQALGFKMNRHEGKLTGLAAYGKPTLAETMQQYFHVADNGEIGCSFQSIRQMKQTILAICKKASREDVAASVQKVLEDTITTSVQRLMQLHRVSQLALAGGVFANVKLNQRLAALPECKEVFIFPAMGDDGLVVGGALEFLLQKDGLQQWAAQRYRLQDVYLGRASTLASSDQAESFDVTKGNVAERVADMLENGKAGAIFSSRMEYGPRALGARTILASPKDARINGILNERLNRSEFMPFAPYVLAEDADTVFEVDDSNRYACNFMTITTDVKPEWREKIPAVVHVDHTARPQTITEAQNPLYAAILRAYKEKTGIPVLVNTSFNAHEEPIINTAEECFKALADGRIDFVVTDDVIYENKVEGKASPQAEKLAS